MAYAGKVVLHLRSTERQGLDVLIEAFMHDGVRFIGVVGPDCVDIEDIVDWICLGPCDGTREPYDMLTSSHDDKSLEDAISFAEAITGNYQGHAFGDRVEVVTLG